MRLTRRNFFEMALSMPVGAALPSYQALAAPAQGLTKVTKIQALQLKDGRTLTRVDTDAGISGYGECNTPGPAARSVIAAYNGAGRLPNLALIGKDPLENMSAAALVRVILSFARCAGMASI
jgi:L-alanine-DL-glutamate epimerase-like enolase superfamily enzyme